MEFTEFLHDLDIEADDGDVHDGDVDGVAVKW